MTISGLYDVHCHLNDPKYFDLDMTSTEIILEAKEAGVDFINNIGYDVKSSKTAVIQANLSSSVFAVVGIHPNYAHLFTHEAYEIIEELAQSNEVVGIGETGLDFSKTDKYQKQQLEAFERQIDLAKKLDLPLMIHLKDHSEQVKVYELAYKLLKEKQVKKAVIHSYEGPLEWAKKFVKLGFLISVSGIVTHNKKVQSVISEISLNSLVVESDAPYYLPTPYKNSLNYPKFLPLTVKYVARLKKVSELVVAQTTRSNAKKLFLKDKVNS
ncbi:TatD family hydrolase [Mycoplasma putrefaciens]|uniref:Hydrolase, TatD deoxyribonuclease family protein n=1 Tax=Mycoplasma putrefaciens (strain ATCC 15718 / NCTC 10155 / C30 KS-1 / KS-1) TaxID=743965 RepID=A0A7U3ZRZ2_MYCPK|nr:TatD family hydrolase [Mycoplasma putrefaciens]AEM68435.1 hydrolase, TatD deoxyribonuclease family protein [Mycoplasma putrefaciens KS1]